MVENYDVIVVGLQPWGVEIGSNCKDIAKELSKRHRVLYVNNPWDINRMFVNKSLKGHNGDSSYSKKTGILKINEGLWVYQPRTIMLSINFINNSSLFNFLNRINNYLFARGILKAINHLKFKHFILFNDNEIFRAFYLKEFLKPILSVYYSRDYLLAVDYWKKHGEDLEPKIISKSDLCVANSTYLRDYCKQYNPSSYYVGQGCDFPEEINDTIPADIKNIPHPIIGYTGALTSLRLDINIISQMAISKPEWSIVLIGPEDADFANSNLHTLKNVFFLGLKKPEELNSYANIFDVCINPQLVNQVTIGNYPRKVDEYLSIGKPVVATLTPAMSIFKDHCYLAENADQYVRLTESALSENTIELQLKRKQFARSHNWENSVGEIYSAIKKELNNKELLNESISH